MGLPPEKGEEGCLHPHVQRAVPCREGREGTGLCRGWGPRSEWRSDQDKQQTAGMERGVSSQTQKNATGIIGRG